VLEHIRYLQTLASFPAQLFKLAFDLGVGVSCTLANEKRDTRKCFKFKFRNNPAIGAKQLRTLAHTVQMSMVQIIENSSCFTLSHFLAVSDLV